MLKEFRIGFNSPPQRDSRLIAIFYKTWNIHQAVSRARRDFPGERFTVQEVQDK